MRRRACLIFVVLCLVTACDKPEPLPLQVGRHHVSVLFPADWEHFDYGEKHQFRRDFDRISIEDMGRLGGNIDRAIERAMVKLGEDGRREGASRDSLQVSGRDARMIDTWDHVSHQYRKRYLFVINERALLVLYTMQGQFETMEQVYTEMATSLAYIDTLEEAGLNGGEN